MRLAKRLMSSLLCSALLISGAAGYEGVGTVSAKAAALEQQGTKAAQAQTTYVVGEDELPYTEEQLYEQIFDLHNKVTIDLDMSNEEMEKLEKDYEKNSSSPIYRMGDVTFTIAGEDGTITSYLVKEAGIRMKGNMTRNKFFNTQTKEVYDLIHFKINFQETFDDTADGYEENEYYQKKWANVENGEELRKKRKNRVFGGMEKLDIKWNGNYDNTYLREYYAYKIYNSEGVWAPQMNLASMNFGDVGANNVYHLGVYSIHECIDKTFINRHVTNEADQGGDLYKASYSGPNGADFTKGCSIGISDDFTGLSFNYDLKTNKKTSDFSLLRNALDTLGKANMTKEIYDSVVDVDSFLKFAAVSYFMGNPDDVRNNYNNHYVYVYPATSEKAGKVVLIPYDYDRCLGVTIGWNPDRSGMTDVSPFSTMAEALKRSQVNPMYVYGVDKGGYYVEEFKRTLAEVVQNELFTEEAFEKEYRIAENLYANDAAISDNLKLADYTSTAGGGKWSAEERIAKFVFSMEDDAETEDYASSRSNITVGNYIPAIKANYQKYLDKLTTQPGYYIETAETGWEPSKDFKMNQSGNIYSFEWKVDKQTIFIIGNMDGKFYRYSALVGDIPKGVSENLAGNIILEPGTYTIQFDESKEEITVYNGKPASKITLKLNANGGKIGSASTKNKTVTVGKKIGSLAAPKRAKYTFSGWYTKKSGGKKVTASTKCTYTGNTTLYAQWKKVSVGKASIKSAKNSASKTIALSLGKVSGAEGYEITYAANSSYKNAKKKTISAANVKLQKLSKGTYYIKVRAYKKDSTGAKLYGKAAAKKIKVTK